MTSTVTQYDLATQLVLNRATVCRVLNGNTKGTKPETAARILAAADAAGYVRPGEAGRPSMAEIGRQLGLSHVSVGAALRGGRRGRTLVSADTRQRVLAKAKELGYEPPPLKGRGREDRWW